MRIGVASLGNISQDTGGKNYIEHFFQNLSKTSSDHTFVLFLSDNEGSMLNLGETPPEIVSIPRTSANAFRKVYGEQVLLPASIRTSGVDVMYFPGNFATFACDVPYVLNIRAVAHYYKGYGIDWPRRTMRKLIMPFSARRAKRIIAPSRDIKNDVVRFTGVDEAKITVIPHGVDLALFDGDENRKSPEGIEFLHSLMLEPANYLLYVSALWRYKNQDKLIRAYAELVHQGKINSKLVIAGAGSSTEKAYVNLIHALPRELGCEDRVVFTGQLKQAELRYLYAHARCFIFPSSYESFGNPIFESWASGIPIAASNVHSFPEVVADAGVLFDPLDEDDLKEAIVRITTDDILRNELIRKGLARAKEFSWEKCIRRTLSVIESV